MRSQEIDDRLDQIELELSELCRRFVLTPVRGDELDRILDRLNHLRAEQHELEIDLIVEAQQ